MANVCEEKLGIHFKIPCWEGHEISGGVNGMFVLMWLWKSKVTFC